VALAPALGAVLAIGGRELWRRRASHLARGTLALMIAGTAVWGFFLMNRDASGWMTGLAWLILVGGVLGAAALAVSSGRLRRLAVAAVLVGTLSALAGTASFTLATVATSHTGSTPTAGPSVVAASTGMGGRVGGPAGGGQPPSGTTTGSTNPGPARTETATSTALVDLLNGTSTRWSAAVVGDQSAATLILGTDTAVMAIGGWGGSDDAPTLAEFQSQVAAGQISYFVAGSGQGGGQGTDGTSSASEITSWVEANFDATTVGGSTVYDLGS
jgi:hypothetical protein